MGSFRRRFGSEFSIKSLVFSGFSNKLSHIKIGWRGNAFSDTTTTKETKKKELSKVNKNSELQHPFCQIFCIHKTTNVVNQVERNSNAIVASISNSVTNSDRRDFDSVGNTHKEAQDRSSLP